MEGAHAAVLNIDGAHGEGGGQILRTALSLAAITGRALRIERIRAGRRNPGLAAQHLTAIRATATITGGTLAGDALGSSTLTFRPGGPARPDSYRFDVADAREGGSAGAATLVLQTVAVPLMLAGGECVVTAAGGTHVPWSPSFDYFDTIWLETLRGLGWRATARLDGWGFYPAGGGGITLRLATRPAGGAAQFRPLVATERGPLVRIDGRAVAASLPSHIAQRMADRAAALLRILDAPLSIGTERVRSPSPGAWIFLKTAYGAGVAGFGAHGRKGKPSEEVAEGAVADLLAFHDTRAAVDCHLADQLLLPLCFAGARSEFTCEAATRHLETNAWVIEQFGVAAIGIRRAPDGAVRVTVDPRA